VKQGDRVVWVGPDRFRPVGSSGKVREAPDYVLVDWGNGVESWCEPGRHVITPEQAAERGIEPWALREAARAVVAHGHECYGGSKLANAIDRLEEALR
jgi:hypothetical protein